MHGNKLSWFLPALSLIACSAGHEGDRPDSHPGYVVRGELPSGIDLEDIVAELPRRGFAVVGDPVTGQLATIVPTSSDAPEIVSEHFQVTAPASCTDCPNGCPPNTREIAIGLMQVSGLPGEPLQIHTHSSMNFSAPTNSPQSWISELDAELEIKTTGTLPTCATFRYYFDIGQCGEGDDCVQCSSGASQQIACGHNDNGVLQQTCVDGQWEDDAPCDDPDECVNGSVDGTGSCTDVCIEGAWVFGCDIIAVTTGDHHTCALRESGNVLCWGSGFHGQLGHGEQADSSTPVYVSNLDDAVAISAGAIHTCAVRETGHVVCWGNGLFGKLGNGLSESATPVPVQSLSDAVDVAAGQNHTCAVRQEGGIACWGLGTSGQLGNGQTESSATPVPVSTLTNALKVTAGGVHTCALRETGGISCWGAGDDGQLGNGTTHQRTTPFGVPGFSYEDVSAGTLHTCALVEGGTLRCWGNNGNGRLGDGTTNDALTPQPVSTITNAANVTAGASHTCAALQSGSLGCWGNGSNGRLGNGSLGDQHTPASVSLIFDGVTVSAGGAHSCVVRLTGQVECWGNGASGQLGNGTTSPSLTPVLALIE